MAQPDLSAFGKANSFMDFEKAAIEEARQRFAQAQQMKQQQAQAEMLQKRLELDQQKFEAEKLQPGGLFGGNSFQAQLGNQMKRMGYSDQQIVEALTTQGVPLQDGGFATYNKVGTVGAPAGSAPQQAMPVPMPQGNMGAKNESFPLPMPEDIARIADDMVSGRYKPGVNVLVEPGMKIADRKEMASNLSKSEQQAKGALDVINKLIDENANLRPEAQASAGGPFGMQGRIASKLPITKNQRRTQPIIDQLKGQAFLTAFEQLKGGGQITEVEGKKATDAIIRLQQYQDDKDFAAALKDLRDVVEAGLARARGINAQFSNEPGIASAPQNVQSNVVNWEDLP